jgi:hypothetical protein
MSKMGSFGSFEHLNTSYGQKKCRESNCQFDSRPQRVQNRPLPNVRFGSATRRWKALNESYNFALDYIAIQGLLAKLWGSKVPGVPFGAISGLPFGSPRKNNHLDVASMESCRVYYKGEGDGFPQVRAMVSLVCPCCPWFVLAPRVLQLCTNHFVWVVCRPVWVSEACQLFLVPSRSSNMPLYPSKCCELGSVLRLLLIPLLSTWAHIWALSGVGSASSSSEILDIILVKNNDDGGRRQTNERWIIPGPKLNDDASIEFTELWSLWSYGI